ncbi:MAG: YfhO family protein, partial [Thermodesulfovibrionales bacterium]|nr:YfhO family protein [Thermodesulfovibrionales bacterium]
MCIRDSFMYMPKDHPDRYHPYTKPPFLELLKEDHPYRIIGDSDSLPPLVSNAMGLYDLRAINVLLQRDYYLFFQNLISFSVPYTNSPNLLVAATSPFIDFVGVKYILSKAPLDFSRLDRSLDFHIQSLRWIRLFSSMKNHSVKGGANYGFFKIGEDERFSFFFPMRFKFRTKITISEPFLFLSFAYKGDSDRASFKVKVTLDNEMVELNLFGDKWQDFWFDVSKFLGKTIYITLQADEKSSGSIVVGNFGLTPGAEKERSIYNILFQIHKKETKYIGYRGYYEGIYIYENKNVMQRVFLAKDVEYLKGLDDLFYKFRNEDNPGQKAYVIKETPHDLRHIKASLKTINENVKERISIKKYAQREVLVDIESTGGILVLSDYYYPGWKVRVNGENREILQAFGVLRGVHIPEGRSMVLFYYEPISIYVGVFLLVITLIIWLFFIKEQRSKL